MGTNSSSIILRKRGPMSLRPYIGITDFTDPEQVLAMRDVFESTGATTRQLHVGVMMSRKTMLGLESMYSKAFPPKERVQQIFYDTQTLNCLHYADYDSDPDLDA